MSLNRKEREDLIQLSRQREGTPDAGPDNSVDSTPNGSKEKIPMPNYSEELSRLIDETTTRLLKQPGETSVEEICHAVIAQHGNQIIESAHAKLRRTVQEWLERLEKQAEEELAEILESWQRKPPKDYQSQKRMILLTAFTMCCPIVIPVLGVNPGIPLEAVLKIIEGLEWPTRKSVLLRTLQ
jgi:hypothetical protein